PSSAAGSRGERRNSTNKPQSRGRSAAALGSASGLPLPGRDASAAPRKHNPPATANPHAAPAPDGLGALALAVPRSPTAIWVSTVVGMAPKRAAATQASSP